jgi:hypothetical protein
MSRNYPQANRNARELMAHLQLLYDEKPTHGRHIEGIANNMDWSYSKTRDTIAWCRNQMVGEDYMIVCFKKGRTWYYKIPTAAEARTYRHARGLDIARRSGNVLFLVRKEAARFGVTRDTRKTAAAYTEMLHWLREAGINEAEEILETALRDLASTNGHRSA